MEHKTVKELKLLAKQRGLTRYSHLRKDELIQLLTPSQQKTLSPSRSISRKMSPSRRSISRKMSPSRSISRKMSPSRSISQQKALSPSRRSISQQKALSPSRSSISRKSRRDQKS